jgi:hypothetical protein
MGVRSAAAACCEVRVAFICACACFVVEGRLARVQGSSQLDRDASTAAAAHFGEWLLGVALLVASLIVAGTRRRRRRRRRAPCGVCVRPRGIEPCVLAAFLGQYQQWVKAQYTPSVAESMFYVHTLSIIPFVANSRSLMEHAALWCARRRWLLLSLGCCRCWMLLRWRRSARVRACDAENPRRRTGPARRRSAPSYHTSVMRRGSPSTGCTSCSMWLRSA